MAAARLFCQDSGKIQRINTAKAGYQLLERSDVANDAADKTVRCSCSAKLFAWSPFTIS